MFTNIKQWLSRRKVRKMMLSRNYLNELDCKQQIVQTCDQCAGQGSQNPHRCRCGTCNGVGLIIVRNVTDPCVDMIPEFVERWDKGMAKWSENHKHRSHPVEFASVQFLIDTARARMKKL